MKEEQLFWTGIILFVCVVINAACAWISPEPRTIIMFALVSVLLLSHNIRENKYE